jgi:hypothetical protein
MRQYELDFSLMFDDQHCLSAFSVKRSNKVFLIAAECMPESAPTFESSAGNAMLLA